MADKPTIDYGAYMREENLAMRPSPLIDMGASFVGAVLADNERLRNENVELNKRLFDNAKMAETKDRNYLDAIYLMAEQAGGDLRLAAIDRGRFDPRRLLIDRDCGGYIERVRLLDDDALGIVRYGEVA